MAVYLEYVRPFTELLSLQQIYDSSLVFSNHVWADSRGLWEMDWLTLIMTQKTALRLEKRLTMLDY